MFFSVVIPTCNRIELLRKCLDQLHPDVQKFRCGYEIIVADDSNNEETKNVIKEEYLWVFYLKSLRKGPAANRNYGAVSAKGEWLIFIDDDCIPDKNLLNEYLNAVKIYPDCLAFEGAIFPDSWVLLKKDMAECPVNTNGGCFWSANICVKKNLFEKVGGFNERFLIAAQEDQQLKIDIEMASKKTIIFLKDAKIVHPVRFPSLKRKLFQIPLASKNFCLYAYYNREILGYTSLFSFFRSQASMHLRKSFFFLKKGMVKNFFVSTVWLCFGVPLNVINFYSLKKTIE